MKLASMVAVLVLVGSGVALAQDTDPDIETAKALVVADFKDPASAQFRDITTGTLDGVVYVCGEVNARNSYGGYTGFSPFAVKGDYALIDGPHMRRVLGEFFDGAFVKASAGCP